MRALGLASLLGREGQLQRVHMAQLDSGLGLDGRGKSIVSRVTSALAFRIKLMRQRGALGGSRRRERAPLVLFSNPLAALSGDRHGAIREAPLRGGRGSAGKRP